RRLLPALWRSLAALRWVVTLLLRRRLLWISCRGRGSRIRSRRLNLLRVVLLFFDKRRPVVRAEAQSLVRINLIARRAACGHCHLSYVNFTPTSIPVGDRL